MKIQHTVIVGLACVAVSFYLLMPRHLRIHSGSFETMKRFSKIGYALENYSYDHDGQLPVKLSELYPQYIGTNGLLVFYPLDSKKLPTDWNSKPELVDTLSDCVYIGASGIPHEVIAYEREKDGNTNRTKLNIIFPHGGGTHVTKQELDDLLSTNASTLLEYFHKDRVMNYEANLYASLNSYRDDFRTYPRGDNASVTKILRGDNPTKRQYHSSYKQERNSNSEDLDPWGTLYFIKSDGNKVQMKSAGSNRTFDQIGSTNFDDICFSVASGSVIGDDTKF
jgi:hypothetical protein